MYFEGTRDMYMPLLPMLFMGSEDETKAKAEPGVDKFLTIYKEVYKLILFVDLLGCKFELYLMY